MVWEGVKTFPCSIRENLPFTPPNARYIAVHPFSNDVPEREALNAAQIGPVPLVESNRVVNDPEVVVDTPLLSSFLYASPSSLRSSYMIYYLFWSMFLTAFLYASSVSGFKSST